MYSIHTQSNVNYIDSRQWGNENSGKEEKTEPLQSNLSHIFTQ